MTLLVAVRGADGLVLAADSRGTFGDPSLTTAQNDSQRKTHILSPHVAVTTAGSGEVAALLVHEARSAIDAAHMDGVTAVMEQLRTTCRAKYEEWFPLVPAIQPPGPVAMGQVPTRPGVNFVIGGYEVGDEEPFEPKIFHLTSWTDFAPTLSDYGWAVDGVAQYALYLLNRLYEADRNVQELTALAIYAITETVSQDGKVGGPVKVITIRPEEGCVALEDAAIEAIIQANDARSTTLRRSFYEQ